MFFPPAEPGRFSPKFITPGAKHKTNLGRFGKLLFPGKKLQFPKTSSQLTNFLFAGTFTNRCSTRHPYLPPPPTLHARSSAARTSAGS
jgi:hypothetical protein